MTRLADITQFEILSQMYAPVINNRVVVDNGFRDTLLQIAQQARQQTAYLAKKAMLAGRRLYKRTKRDLDVWATNKLIKKIQPIDQKILRKWAQEFLEDRMGTRHLRLIDGYSANKPIPLVLPPHTTPIGRKNVEAFLARLERIQFTGDEALFNPKTFEGWYSSRGRFANYVAKCINLLAGLNVDVSNILRTLEYSKTYQRDNKTGEYLPGKTRRYRESHLSDKNQIMMSPESAAESLFHEFLHAIHMNPYMAQAINKKGLVDTAIKKFAPYNILKRFYDLYYDDGDVFLLDKRRAKRAGDEYTGKTYPVRQDSPTSKTRSWYSQSKNGQLIRKYGFVDREGNPRWFTDHTEQVPEISALKDLLSRPTRSSEYLSMLSNLLTQRKGRLNFFYAMDILKRIKAAEKAQAKQDALDRDFNRM